MTNSDWGEAQTSDSLAAAIAQIDCTEVREDQLTAPPSEDAFVQLAFNLLRETTQWVILFARLNFSPDPHWNIRQAILGGHLVRLSKLNRALLDNSNEQREDLMWIFLRLVAECVINFRFLLSCPSDEVFNSYLQHSLQHDRDLLSKIDANIAARGGDELPIESRMRQSIQRAFERSGIDPAALPSNRVRNWGGKNLFEKAQTVGLTEDYFAIIGGPSRNIHGGWRDLLEHHINFEGADRFTPKLDFRQRTRPQPFFAVANLIVPGLIEYARFLGAVELNAVVRLLSDLGGRIASGDRLHENYLFVRKRD